MRDATTATRWQKQPMTMASVVLTIIVAAAFTSIRAQSSIPGTIGPAISFSAVHARRSSSSSARLLVRPMGRLSVNGITFADLVRRAYGGGTYATGQIVDGPSWIYTDRFDIEARSNGTLRSSNGVINKGDIRNLLLALLQTRYKLDAEVQTREVAAFRLIRIANSTLGSGLRATTETCLGPLEYIDVENAIPPQACPFVIGPGRLHAGALTMAEFASLLSEFPAVRKMVRDDTRLSGRFDVDFAFTPSFQALPDGRLSPTTTLTGPDLHTAIRDQLGLALVSDRLRTNVVVVKSIVAP
jgi:uncharacterized protein (TIGR03435 family)